jgi:hypothetical protein
MIHDQKPFSDGEFLKSCFIESAKLLYSSFKNKESIVHSIENMQLSRTTVQRRLNFLKQDIYQQNIKILKGAEFFSIALDETTDKTDISQLSIWFRSIDTKFNITTDILTVKSLYKQTRAL